jgi:tetratricopeptide (TPR) repeat protein
MDNNRFICPNLWINLNINYTGMTSPCKTISSTTIEEQNLMRVRSLTGLHNDKCHSCLYAEEDKASSLRHKSIINNPNIDNIYRDTNFDGKSTQRPLKLQIDFSGSDNTSTRSYSSSLSKKQQVEFKNILKSNPSLVIFENLNMSDTGLKNSDKGLLAKIIYLTGNDPEYFSLIDSVEVSVSEESSPEFIKILLSKILSDKRETKPQLIITSNTESSFNNIDNCFELFRKVEYRLNFHSLHPEQKYIMPEFNINSFNKKLESWLPQLTGNLKTKIFINIDIYNITYVVDVIKNLKLSLKSVLTSPNISFQLSFKTEITLFSPFNITKEMKEMLLVDLNDAKRTETSYAISQLLNDTIRSIKLSKIETQPNNLATFILYNEIIDKQWGTKLSDSIIKGITSSNINTYLELNRKTILSNLAKSALGESTSKEQLPTVKELLNLTLLEEEEIDEYKNVGISLYEEGKALESLEFFRKVLANKPDDVIELKRVAWLCFDLGILDEAFELFQKILNINEQDKDATRTLVLGGWNNLKQENLEKLISFYNQKISENSYKHYPALKSLAWIYLEKGLVNDFFLTLMKAFMVHPNDQEILDPLNTTNWKELTNDNRKSLIKFYQDRLKSRPNDPVIANALSLVVEKSEMPITEPAQTDTYLQTLKEIENLLKVGRNNLIQGKFKETINIIKTVEKIRPHFQQTLSLVLDTANYQPSEELGHFSQDYLLKAQAKKPKDLGLRKDYIFYYYKIHKLHLTEQESSVVKSAILFYKDLLNKFPNNLDILKILGWQHKKIKKYKDALDYFKRALSISPGDNDCLIEISRLSKSTILKIVDKLVGILKGKK